ncbi:sigma-70 family RNA polymerase sigma factor [Shewanella sp. WXL01]|uniref:sigma-70 family RNA polymerase sigma factor n=1 Tax=Shewanella TaxID=22 RepID=UPI0013EE8793|nr:sigma-70 family RNA polymerase sigma factor [Shewanella maritima]NKF49044.1 sigma-70 family RNA polymerase sigma factor [Shewanella sp. WXL01]
MSIRELANATELLQGWQSRDKSQSAEFLTYAYQDIRAIVERYLSQHQPNQTLLHDASITELASESVVKLHRWRNDEQPFASRQEFFDYVRVSVWHLLFGKPHQSMVNKQQAKHEFLHQQLDETEVELPNWTENLNLSAALELLQQAHPRQAEVFELKHFAMVSHQQVADMLELSPRTVDNDLKFATVWLRAKLS